MEMAGSKRKDKAVAERGERRGHRHKGHDGDRLSAAWVRQQEEVTGLLGLVVMPSTERG